MRDGGVTYLVHARQPRLNLLRDVLYAIVGQLYPGVVGLVLVGDGDDNPAFFDLVSRMDGVGGVVVRPLPGPPDMAAAFHAGLQAVETEYCAFLDDLDLVYPRHAALLAGCIEGAPTAQGARGAVYAARGFLTPDGFMTDCKHRQPVTAAALVPTAMAPASFLLRSAELKRAGMVFDPVAGGDCRSALLAALPARLTVALVDQPVAEVRSIETSPWRLTEQPA